MLRAIMQLTEEQLDASHDFFQGMLALTTPFTLIPGQNPTVTMAFDTSTAVAALDGDGCACWSR